MSSRAIIKDELKEALEEMMRERNPALEGIFEAILQKMLVPASDRSEPLDMDEVRKMYAVRRESFAPLHDLFKDAPPASEMVKKLRK